MNSTEEKRIFAWASENSSDKDILCSQKEAAKNSYFETFAEKEDVYEYGFETAAELEKQLKKRWQGDEVMAGIIRTCAVATFKNKPQEKPAGQQNSVSSASNVEIKDFVYDF